MKPTILICIAACGLLTSCAGIGSAISGQPIPTVPVQRVGGSVPFNVSAADVARAEIQTGTVWGLYDAGLVAGAAAQLVTAGK